MGNQVIVIKPEVEVAQDSGVQADSSTPRVGLLTWAFFLLSLACTASVVAMLIYFFKEPPPELLPEQLLSRFNSLAAGATILGGVAVIIGAGIFYYARQKEYGGRVLVNVAGLLVICLAAGVFVTAVFCWAKTERVQALSPQDLASGNPLLRRLQSGTTVVHALNARTDRYRSAKGAGVIIGRKSGLTWILTVPYPEESSWRDLPRADALWVNFSDGRSFPGRLRWSAQQPINLAIIEVETNAPTGQVQFHPIAEAVIPSTEVLVVSNPLYAGWKLEQGSVLKRRGLRTETGWNCLVDVDLNLRSDDVGSGMYDQSGRLLGLNAGFDRRDGTTKFVIVSSDIMRRITAAGESGNFDALEAISLNGRRP